jgi:hypothetical protein
MMLMRVKPVEPAPGTPEFEAKKLAEMRKRHLAPKVNPRR